MEINFNKTLKNSIIADQIQFNEKIVDLKIVLCDNQHLYVVVSSLLYTKLFILKSEQYLQGIVEIVEVKTLKPRSITKISSWKKNKKTYFT